MKTRFIALGATAILGLGMALQASATPVFTVDPSSIGNPSSGIAQNAFDSNFIGGTSSSLLTLTNPATQSITGAGWIQFTGFNNPDGSGNIGPGITGLGLTYTLWAEYQYQGAITSGVFGQPLSVATITGLEFEFYAAPNDNAFNTTTVFTASNAVNTPATGATVVAGAGTQLLATGSLLEGTAVLNSLGGSALNAVTSFGLTPFGSTFFTDPVPFYNVAFSFFNNTGPGVVQGADDDGNFVLAINNAGGGVDFNRVPEPATIALMGLGLLGLGALSNRRRKPAVSA